LGLINYDRLFIKRITEKIKPLYRLLEKEVKFEWGEIEADTFYKIKKEWEENLELSIPEMSGNFVLECDASDVGIGAVLFQNLKPIAFISRSLTKAERNYGITEREVLACLWSMEKLRFYLDWKEFKLITDHKPIEEIRRKADFGSHRLARWIERLQRYNFVVEYKKGEDLIGAYALSRSVLSLENRENHLSNDIETVIFKLHRELNHRKTIKKNLEKIGITISNSKLLEVLKDCDVCKRKDKRQVGAVALYQLQNLGKV
jgi:hypothetical protein